MDELIKSKALCACGHTDNQGQESDFYLKTKFSFMFGGLSLRQSDGGLCDLGSNSISLTVSNRMSHTV